MLFAWAAVALAVVASGAGCQPIVRSSRIEDRARSLVPVPVCLSALPRRPAPGSVVSLEPEEYWPLLLPSSRPQTDPVEREIRDCAGRRPLASLPSASSSAPDVDATVVAPGPDGLRTVWLPSHRLEGGPRAGVLALVRQSGAFLEVYAIGLHRGEPASTRFALERMGYDLAIAATEEQCRGAGETRVCNSTAQVYLLGTGELKPAVSYPVDQVLVAAAPRGNGEATYRFSASAEYREGEILLTEHLSVQHAQHGEILSSDLERSLRLVGTEIQASEASLWARTLESLESQRPRPLRPH